MAGGVTEHAYGALSVFPERSNYSNRQSAHGIGPFPSPWIFAAGFLCESRQPAGFIYPAFGTPHAARMKRKCEGDRLTDSKVHWTVTIVSLCSLRGQGAASGTPD